MHLNADFGLVGRKLKEKIKCLSREKLQCSNEKIKMATKITIHKLKYEYQLSMEPPTGEISCKI